MPNRKRIDPREQFSKWLARSGSIYWIVFHTLLMVLMYLRPDIATACVYLSIIVSVVMIIHVWAYTRNSIYEKSLLSLLDKTKMELSLKGTDGKINIAKDTQNGDIEIENGEDETEYHEEEGDYDNE